MNTGNSRGRQNPSDSSFSFGGGHPSASSFSFGGGGGDAPGASCSPTTQDNGGKNGGSGIVIIRYKFQ